MAENKTRLWFQFQTPADEIEREIRQHAEQVEYLRFDCDDFFTPQRLKGIELPRLRDLAMSPLHPLKVDFVLDWLNGLPSLIRLDSFCVKASDSMFTQIAKSSWWPRLTYFGAKFRDLKSSDAWTSLWQSRPLALQILCLQYLDTPQAQAVITGDFPDLRWLILGYEIRDEFLQTIASAKLPKLTDLELRFTNVSPDGFRAFVKMPHPGLPNLQRIGWKCSSDRREDYCDWNGAVVDWSYEWMTDNELRKEFFKGTNLTLAPLDHTLSQKMDYSQAQYAFGRFLEHLQ